MDFNINMEEHHQEPSPYHSGPQNDIEKKTYDNYEPEGKPDDATI